jgi:hypothetical protein
MQLSLEKLHFVNALAPVADALSGTIGTDVINAKNAGKIFFVLQKGVGTTGTSTITVEACDDVTPSNTTAIPFRYKNIVTGDTDVAITEAAAAGFTTTAGSNHLILVEVDAVEVTKAGYGYVRLAAVEVADDPVLAGILGFISNPRYSYSAGDTAIV